MKEWPRNARQVAEREIGALTLVKTGTAECGCPEYRVAQGKVSEMIEQSDTLCIQSKECHDTNGTH